MSLDAYWDIQRFFFAFPRRACSLSQLAETLSIHKGTASRAVKRLEHEGFLNVEILGRIWRITCVMDHRYHVSRKVPYHLGLILDSTLIDTIRTAHPTGAIVLYGSVRKGDDVESSDIDLAIESTNDRIEALDPIDLGYRSSVPVNLRFFSRKRIDPHLFSNIGNGIVLDGFLEVYAGQKAGS
jgi:hypothetical protein